MTKQIWLDWLGKPSDAFEPTLSPVQKTFALPGCRGELYLQKNGADTVQRVMLLFPEKREEACPGVVVPFYYPEAMLGMDPFTGETLPRFDGIAMMLHLVRRGYAVISADAYHLTCHASEKDRDDFSRWHDAAVLLRKKHPGWTGMGKLTADTMLLTDIFSADPRVDAERLGIAGHSLGGKMAFYAGCLDDRIKVILASDFGIGWDQTNWRDIWYWGTKVEELQSAGLNHSSLLGCSASKPMCLLAGQYDDMTSWEMMQAAPGYETCPEKLKIVHHAAGHRPPADALEEGYAFLDQWLK